MPQRAADRKQGRILTRRSRNARAECFNPEMDAVAKKIGTDVTMSSKILKAATVARAMLLEPRGFCAVPATLIEDENRVGAEGVSLWRPVEMKLHGSVLQARSRSVAGVPR